ncbi:MULTISPECIES: LysR substrate-binding domain-containing protein [Gammaproteobacteria]|jgi:DNA-binding transcriptional LysR family regulator|uniref:LysR family transcriptional regulator n=1 Tax=Vreelandella halophila TaxID=86177 RepID=A0A9X4YBA5_9GAMM|nr:MULTISPECIES: LysR substrate-binding domain-containing protein [Gammaproteobacteria]KAA8984505.1 LysR family transcriptional regulator [Halospina sp. K52047b]MYL26737.1 LysR family transcriptional regulator [Halomonas utahensis]MYL75554.1 LysR family transcriptional regulator [Halomonas sp. 22501_18_FS]
MKRTQNSQSLPSLQSLVAFEATARLGSMTAAADEERTTQPAISQRIRALEEWAGMPLFDRKGGKLQLTAKGERFRREVSSGLSGIRGACDRLLREGEGPAPSVVIAAGSGFLHLWLLPHLPAMKQAFPEVTFTLKPIDRADDPELQAADIAIRFGPYLPQEESQLLAREEVFPVTSPDYARSNALGSELKASDLDHVTLLHQDIHEPRWLDWLQWCDQVGIELAPREDYFAYHNYALLLHATLARQGVALGWSILVEEYLKTGQLIALGPRIKRTEYGYWLSAKHHRSAVVQPICDWLMAAMQPYQPVDARY